MKTSDFDYELPPELIAQEPLAERDASRLMRLDRHISQITHHSFRDLPELLRAGDLLVFNDTRVIPARLLGTKIPRGGRVELLLLEELAPNRWRALARARSKIRAGDEIAITAQASQAQRRAVLTRFDPGTETFEVDFLGAPDIRAELDALGLMPLPPYIKRAVAPGDRERYQTVYARSEGAVAAPTAGLHFTPRIFDGLKARGLTTAFLTLHVGLGTFQPVKTGRVADHKMHAEHFRIPSESVAAVARAKREGRRVVAVGTTVVRALESVAERLRDDSAVQPIQGSTSLFIHPPYPFGVVDALLTNFHLPRSTLLMMVCAFGGSEFVLQAYRAAVAERYRFYSYGDCMLIV